MSNSGKPVRLAKESF